jgi:hypothetical protein
MSVFKRYLTNCRVDQVHFGLVIVRKLIRLISIIKNPSQQLQAGKIFYVRFCLKSTKLPLSQLEPAVQNTAFLCAQQIFKPHQYQISFFSNHRVNFPFFAVVFAVVKKI